MLTLSRLISLLKPYVAGLDLPPGTYERCLEYLDLLLRWNARTNLTAVRDPEQLATRQLGESLFAASCIPCVGKVLDFGSGAGFPGIPVQLAMPSLNVTLAEAQGKKASFLREAVRVLELPCPVWAGRVEDMPGDCQFDVVIMRAVDRSEIMTPIAAARVAGGGSLLRFQSAQVGIEPMAGWAAVQTLPVPESVGQLVRLQRA